LNAECIPLIFTKGVFHGYHPVEYEMDEAYIHSMASPLSSLTRSAPPLRSDERKVRKAFIISNLFSKLTNVNALEDAETYRKLNDLFKLSGSKSTLVFPSAYCKNLVDSDTIELLRKAVKEPEQEEQICDEVACKIPQQLKYADGVQVSSGDIRQLVDFTRQQGLVH
jgi:hypothetical protein